MKHLPGHDTCVGCGICVQVCPTHCISFSEDENGFKQPSFNKETCIDCLKCENYCPVLSKPCQVNRAGGEILVYACRHVDENVQKKSSSGGFFTALCEAFFTLYEQAFVCGAVLQKDLSVRHEMTGKLEDVSRFVGSKYLQSDITAVLPLVLKELKLGKFVLFSGTPCQIAALYSFVRCDYDNLYTCEVICHGVPSPYHFRKQNEYWESRYRSKISSLNFRSKSICWEIPTTKYLFQKGIPVYFRTEKNSFMSAFYAGLNLRGSCYSCKYADLPRIADFTMGDFWGYSKNRVFPLREIVNGISVVLCNNAKADDLFDYAQKYLKASSSSLEKAVSGNMHIVRSVSKSLRERNDFLADLHRLPIAEIDQKYFSVPFLKKIGLMMNNKWMRYYYYLKMCISKNG